MESSTGSGCHPDDVDASRPNEDGNAGTLYVLGPEHVAAMAPRLDPATDVLGRVDGPLVAAPGWRGCVPCTAPVEPVRVVDLASPLAVGDMGLLGLQAGASGYLRGGWWPPDAAGSWSQEQADMSIPLSAELPEAATLVLTGAAFVGPGLPTQHVVAGVPGQPASETRQSVAGEGAIRLPPRRDWLQAEPDGSYRLHLRLRFPDADSPARLGMSVDARRLGFSPSTVRLEGR